MYSNDSEPTILTVVTIDNTIRDITVCLTKLIIVLFILIIILG